MTDVKPMIAADPFASAPPAMRWILERAMPEADAMAMVTATDTPDSVLTNWLSGAQAPSAMRMLAHALPVREGAWWAWVSARHATQLPGAPVSTPQEQAALTAVEQWIVRPDDNARRAVWEAGQAAGVDTPIGLVTAAIFLSGGSVAPPNVAHVPPPPGVSSTLIAAAVLLAATSDPGSTESVSSAFVAQGLEIVRRLGGWEQAMASARQRYDLQVQEQPRGGSS